MTESLANHTTFRLGGPARRFVEATIEKQLIDTVADCDSRGEPVLVLGGGSNVLIADEGFDGTVVKVATRGVRAEAADCSGAQLEVAAGETWDDLVARAVAAQWSGMETLSGIPGSVGAVPIQNVGAYGAEVATLIQRVRTWDRAEGAIRTFAAAECDFSYRTSRFKREAGRYVGIKTSAAWLIQHAGFPAGYGSGPATLSTRHVLALTNRGQATTGDVVSLAREIRDGVRERFGITLVPEVNLVGVGI